MKLLQNVFAGFLSLS